MKIPWLYALTARTYAVENPCPISSRFRMKAFYRASGYAYLRIRCLGRRFFSISVSLAKKYLSASPCGAGSFFLGRGFFFLPVQ